MDTNTQSLIFLAKALAHQFNVRVTTNDGGAYCYKEHDRYVVNIPPVIDGEGADTDSLILGYVAHECGHIQHTDLNSLSDDEMLHALENILEDVRIEALMAREFAGVGRAFQTLQTSVFEEPSFVAEQLATEGLARASTAILWEVRHLTHAVDAWETVDPNLKRELMPVLANARTTPDAVKRDAKALYDILERYFGSLAKPKSGKGKATSGNGGDDKGESQGGSEQEGSGQGGKLGSDLSANELNALDISKRAAEKINAKVNQIPDRGVDRSLTITRSGTNNLPADFKARARAKAHSLSQALISILQTQSRGTRIAKHGRLDTRRLTRTAFADMSVFKNKTIKPDINAHITLIADASGSMSGYGDSAPINIEGESLYAIAWAMSQVKGITTSAYAFSGTDFLILKEPQDTVEQGRFKTIASGGTLGGQALIQALKLLPTRYPAPKQVIIFMTDGELDDPSTFEAVRQDAEEHGILIFGIGIGMELSLNCPCKSIHNIDGLGQALHDIIKEVVI